MPDFHCIQRPPRNDHPFYVTERSDGKTNAQPRPKPQGHEDLNSNWVGAGHLQIGDKIKQADGTTGVVANVITVEQTQEMFNLTVSEAHTFYVGTNGWLVHNAYCGPEFINLRSHARKHGADVGTSTTQQYLDSALGNVQNGTRFLVTHESQTKAGYITKIGEDKYLYTGTNVSGRVIYTHMPVDSKYLRNIGITLPKGMK